MWLRSNQRNTIFCPPPGFWYRRQDWFRVSCSMAVFFILYVCILSLSFSFIFICFIYLCHYTPPAGPTASGTDRSRVGHVTTPLHGRRTVPRCSFWDVIGTSICRRDLHAEPYMHEHTHRARFTPMLHKTGATRALRSRFRTRSPTSIHTASAFHTAWYLA